MKVLSVLFTTSSLLFGQTSVVTCFEDGDHALADEGLTIGIVPIEDYHKVQHELSVLKKELDTALLERAAAVRAFEQVKGRSNDTGLGLSMADVRTVAALQEELHSARQDWQVAMKREQAVYQTREKDLLGRIVGLEKERATLTADFEKQIGELHVKFGKEQEAWEKRMVQAENARLAAERKLEESELIRVRDHEAWQKSVQDWQAKVQDAVRSAQIREAQATVETTAKLAKEWKGKREALEAEILRLKNEMAEIEGQLGVKGFEENQAGVLRLGLMEKSTALEALGAKAEKLAQAWRTEREESSRELQAMKDLYESSAAELAEQNGELTALQGQLTGKNAELEKLSTMATRLAEDWRTEKGVFETQMDDLQKKLAACEADLAQAKLKVTAADKTEEALRQECLALLTNQKEWQKQKSGLLDQAAAMQSLTEKLGLSTEREKANQVRLKSMEEELKTMQGQLQEHQTQRDQSAQKVDGLEKELDKARDQYAAAERDLQAALEGRDAAISENENLRAMTAQLEQALNKAQKDIQQVREQADKARKEASPAQQEKMAEMESQLGRLSKAQQDLQGTLTATLNDFENLQKSYLELREDAADGGKTALEAEAKAKAAEEELGRLQKRLQEQEKALQEARDKAQKVEEDKKAAQLEAAAGKEALGKCEGELQGVRRELGKLQLGHEVLVKEAKSLRDRFIQIEPVRYQLASANVVAQQERVLAEVRQILEIYPQARFAIRGHTCNLGSAEANLRLSEERAKTLKDFLTANGIPEDRIAEASGAGDSEPEASNESDEGRRQNRRVEIEVVE